MGRTTTTAITVLVGIGSLAACSAGEEDQAAGDAAASEATDAPAQVADAGGAEGEGAPVAADETAGTTPGAEDPAGRGTDAPSDVAGTIQQTGTLAVQASATVAVDDVTAAVDAVTSAVVAAGGRVASADVDHQPATGDEPDRSRARLVLDVPPDALESVMTTVEGLGTVTNYDQLAEDVAEQLTDLDVRIANERASIERVRELVDTAGSLQDLVFLEAELTSRETQLGTLLATQRTLVERVAMSTLTLDLTTVAPAVPGPTPVLRGTVEPADGLGEAFARGWDAFTGALFTIVFVLALLAPFLAVAAAAGLVVLVLRRAVRRGHDGGPPPADGEEPETTDAEATDDEPAPAGTG